jgi:glutamate/tyrosine decarboxylase-like PLP-dependent enzyme
MKNYQKILETELTLDNPDFEKMRALGKKMIDDSVDYLQYIASEPVWKGIPDATKDFFKTDLPLEGSDPEKVYNEFCEHIFPYSKGNIHPRFWGWIQGGGTLFGAFADMLAATMNSNNSIGEHSAVYVENQVLDWSKKIIGYDKNSSGILTSGGSMANATGLVVARNSYDNLNIRKYGLAKISAKFVIYVSSEAHSCLEKSAEFIGLGSDSVRKVPVDKRYEMDIQSLQKMIADDMRQNFIPLCIVGNAGTTNTGAIDDLDKIADICAQYKIWFHVDGAYGALAKITDEYGERLKSIERADSVAFDFHKWFYINYEVGCLLVKDKNKHRDSFVLTPNYLMRHERGSAAGPESFGNFGIELSRSFKSLKVWMSLKKSGLKKYKQLISQNIAQALYLADLIRKEEKLELMSEPSLSILCYRFNPKQLSNDDLNKLNKEILMILQERGIALPSSTLLGGDYVIRVCITNHRSKKNDFEVLVKETLKIGEEVLSTFGEKILKL